MHMMMFSGEYTHKVRSLLTVKIQMHEDAPILMLLMVPFLSVSVCNAIDGVFSLYVYL
jgi:hypothetical protein